MKKLTTLSICLLAGLGLIATDSVDSFAQVNSSQHGKQVQRHQNKVQHTPRLVQPHSNNKVERTPNIVNRTQNKVVRNPQKVERTPIIVNRPPVLVGSAKLLSGTNNNPDKNKIDGCDNIRKTIMNGVGRKRLSAQCNVYLSNKDAINQCGIGNLIQANIAIPDV